MDFNLETYKQLEENGVYIHYIAEHYKDGSNLNFSIEFKNQKTQTGWYNDNHEFGDVYETIVSSMKIAMWYLEDLTRVSLINSGYNNPDYIKYRDDLSQFIRKITKIYKMVTPEQAKDQLIELLMGQVADLSMMSKIELGNDVIDEIKRLQAIINEPTR